MSAADFGEHFDESLLLENSPEFKATSSSSSAAAGSSAASASEALPVSSGVLSLSERKGNNPNLPIEECPIFRVVALDAPSGALGSAGNPLLTR